MAHFEITNAYIAVGGVQATPKISEAFSLNVDFTVHGTPTAPYVVRFNVAEQKQESTETALTPGPRSLSVPYGTLPLDGEIPWTVHIDPDHVTSSPHTGTPIRQGSFEPVPPNTGIEYYDPVYVHLVQQLGVDFTGDIGEVKAMIGRPSNGVWQNVLSTQSFAYRYVAGTSSAYRFVSVIGSKR